MACRNVLIGINKVLKVADFGAALEVEGVFVVEGSNDLPIRWMSPEVLTKNTFSEKSDV